MKIYKKKSMKIFQKEIKEKNEEKIGDNLDSVSGMALESTTSNQ